MDETIVSDEVRLWRKATNTWLTVTLLAEMAVAEWDVFVTLKYPGFRVVQIKHPRIVKEDKNYGC